MDFETEMLTLNDELMKAYANMDMANELFDTVVERTGNFREGFYSSKKFRDLGRSAVRQMQRRQALVSGPEDVLEMMREIVQNMKNVAATIEAEVERIDY